MCKWTVDDERKVFKDLKKNNLLGWSDNSPVLNQTKFVGKL